jgi:hypothetical protein
MRGGHSGCGNRGPPAATTRRNLVPAISLVQKAVHLFRHPLDHIVARFHLAYNTKADMGDEAFLSEFPKNKTGFHRWCARNEENKDLLTSRLVDAALRRALHRIPCFSEFFRYVQWHNLAFQVTRDELRIPVLVLHYEEYATNFTAVRDRLLDFLEFPHLGEGIEFLSGRTYQSYFSLQQQEEIQAFLIEFASADTWEYLKGYDFGR